MVGTTSPDWRSSLRHPGGVAGGYGQYSPGEFLFSVTPGTTKKVQVICGYVACHVMHNVLPTIRASPCLRIAKPALALPPHQLQISVSSCHPRQQRCGPLSSQVAHLPHRDCRTGHTGHIHKRYIMEPPGRRSGVRYEHSDTVLGPTGQHPSRFDVPQARHVWDDSGV